MVKKKTIKNASWVSVGIGYGILFVSHIAILVFGMSQEGVKTHAVLNLVAGGLLVGGYVIILRK